MSANQVVKDGSYQGVHEAYKTRTKVMKSDARYIDSVDHDTATCRIYKPQDAHSKGGLSTASTTQKANTFLGFECKRHIMDNSR